MWPSPRRTPFTGCRDIRAEKWTQCFWTNFLNTPRSLGHPGKIPGTSRFLPSKPKIDKLSREGANFLTPTPPALFFLPEIFSKAIRPGKVMLSCPPNTSFFVPCPGPFLARPSPGLVSFWANPTYPGFQSESSSFCLFSFLTYMSSRSAKRPRRSAMRMVQPEFWGEFLDVNFGRWISWGWIFEGPLFIGFENIGPKKSTPEFGPKFGAQKFASQNSTPNSGSRGAKSPLRKLAPDVLVSPVSRNLGSTKLCFFQTVFFSKPCFCPAENFGAVFELSLPILYPLPSLMLRRAVPSEYHGVFSTSRNYSPNPHPWSHPLGGMFPPWWAPEKLRDAPAKKGCFWRKWRNWRKSKYAYFYRVWAPDWRKWRKWRNWRKHPEIGGARISTTLMQIGALGPEPGRG